MKQPTKEQKFMGFVKVCIATRQYYWKYSPAPFLNKIKDQPTYLGDSVIQSHIVGKEVLGLSPFVDKLNVLYGGVDFDVHGFTKGEIKRREQEGESKEQIKKAEDDFLKTQRKQIKEDIPKITKELDKKKILYFLNSSGSEGIHLRVYSNKPTNAKIMRYFLIDLQERILKEVRHEVFPKQDELNDDTPFGNQMKGVLAIHPKTGKLAGIIKDGKVLDREESLMFIFNFAKKIDKATEIKFDIPPELEAKHKKVKFKGDLKFVEGSCPNYCAGFEEVAPKQILPSTGKASRHDFLDGNAYQYLQDKPELFKSYCEIQGRDDSAFNKCENWKWNCPTIHKYLNANTGKGIEKWKKCCDKCPLFCKSYMEILEPLIKKKDNLETRNRIIKDILQENDELAPIDVKTLIEQINQITGEDEKILRDQWETTRKKDVIDDDKITYTKKKLKALKELEYRKLALEQAQNKTDEELKKMVDLNFILYPPLARYLAVLYIQRKFVIMTEYRTDVIKAYSHEKKYFETIGSEMIKTFLTKEFNIKNNRTTSSEILHLLRTMTYKLDEDIQKASPFNLIPFKNCILDLDTMETLEHDPRYLFDFQIPVKYDPSAICPNIDKFISKVVGEKDVSLVYDMMGLCLYRVNYLDKFFVLTGSGSNGKSRLLTLLEMLIGDENCSSITLKNLTDDKFAVAKTYKKLVNIGADIGGQKIWDTSMLKSASSRDKISGQFKFGQIFDFVPSATEIFSANDPPQFGDDSDGMYRRIELIHFPHTFGNQEDKKENEDVIIANPNIIEQISTPEEMSGLLNKVIISLLCIIHKGQLSVVRSTGQLKKDYTKYSNNVRAFVEECCEEVEYIPPDKDKDSTGVVNLPAQGFVTTADLFTAYGEFCSKNKLIRKTKDQFAKTMRKLESWNLEFQQDWKDENNPQHKERSIRGIGLK